MLKNCCRRKTLKNLVDLRADGGYVVLDLN